MRTRLALGRTARGTLLNQRDEHTPARPKEITDPVQFTFLFISLVARRTRPTICTSVGTTSRPRWYAGRVDRVDRLSSAATHRAASSACSAHTDEMTNPVQSARMSSP